MSIRESLASWRAIWRMSDRDLWRFGLFLRHVGDQLEAQEARLAAATRVDRARAERLEALGRDIAAMRRPEHVHGAWCHPSADGCPDRPGM